MIDGDEIIDDGVVYDGVVIPLIEVMMIIDDDFCCFLELPQEE